MKTLTPPAVPATLAFAKTLFTRGTDAFGAEEIAQALRLPVSQIGGVPPVPFSENELKRARELGQYLIYQIAMAQGGKPLTMKCMHDQTKNKLGDGKLLYAVDWYPKEDFYTKDTPRFGWALVGRGFIPGSTGVNYIEQTRVLSDYLVGEVFKDQELPDQYQAAVDEFKARKAELEELLENDWKKCSEELAGLKLNILFHEKPVEVLYGLVVQHEINRERLLENTYAWTNQRSSYGYLVYIGCCDSGGVDVDYHEPDRSDSPLGVRFFRSGPANSGS